MIRHIVFWKFRPDADPEPFLQALSALPEQIDWIRGMHVARSAAPNAAWDACPASAACLSPWLAPQ